MALPGETIASGAKETCADCGVTVEIKPQRWSVAGYAICSFCDCGPYSRESEYFDTLEEAEAAFKTGAYGRG